MTLNSPEHQIPLQEPNSLRWRHLYWTSYDTSISRTEPLLWISWKALCQNNIVDCQAYLKWLEQNIPPKGEQRKLKQHLLFFSGKRGSIFKYQLFKFSYLTSEKPNEHTQQPPEPHHTETTRHKPERHLALLNPAGVTQVLSSTFVCTPVVSSILNLATQ